jgi:hypothetical protein
MFQATEQFKPFNQTTKYTPSSLQYRNSRDKKAGHAATNTPTLDIQQSPRSERALEVKSDGAGEQTGGGDIASGTGSLSLTHFFSLSNLEVLYFIFSYALNMASFSQNSFLAAPNREIWRPHCDRLTRAVCE